MPTYEYKCANCGGFEKFQNMSDAVLANCPTCNGPVERLIGTGSGMIFKGSGFYQTDYKTPAAPPAKCESCPSAGNCASAG